MDANEWDEEERRRSSFGRWLSKAWEWANEEGGRPALAKKLAELASHADDLEYPLWAVAAKEGIVGDSRTAEALRLACGLPVQGPTPTEWEKQINYRPVIYLDEKVWRHIHGALGWANRDYDPRIAQPNFWLMSTNANIVHFVMKDKIVGEEEP